VEYLIPKGQLEDLGMLAQEALGTVVLVRQLMWSPRRDLIGEVFDVAYGQYLMIS
jgi:hypothetical protein